MHANKGAGNVAFLTSVLVFCRLNQTTLSGPGESALCVSVCALHEGNAALQTRYSDAFRQFRKVLCAGTGSSGIGTLQTKHWCRQVSALNGLRHASHACKALYCCCLARLRVVIGLAC